MVGFRETNSTLATGNLPSFQAETRSFGLSSLHPYIVNSTQLFPPCIKIGDGRIHNIYFPVGSCILIHRVYLVPDAAAPACTGSPPAAVYIYVRLKSRGSISIINFPPNRARGAREAALNSRASVHRRRGRARQEETVLSFVHAPT